ncbi:NAD-dependent epimerase/dehydratase family protein [Umezawaea tangerina]|uniref:Nucleoside-diphosphate-sugar epimerase n=1 Tax=Umezawaea tangerina TaxID=84725 RepID=A0A2T0SZI5_9PSEU|nr:NAD(P)-dependent oxidoreductase [Umezawaea tangerina]PRY38828.1 nucleoside-diphosphate-sugar epimerase [Umezawaea tangerina]
MRVLVAGATGLVGSALLPLLRARGHHVTAMVRDGSRTAEADEVVVADALDPVAVRLALRAARADVVVHQLTALRQMSADAMETTARLRTEGTANLITAAREAGTRKLVVQSIAFATAPLGGPVLDEDAPLHLDAPDPSWARTVQAVAELERLVLGTPDIAGTILRYGTLFGARTQYDPEGPFGARVGRGRMPLPEDAVGVTSFLHVDDAATAALSAVDSEVTGVFNIADDDPAEGAAWLPEYARMLGAPEPRVLDAEMAQRVLGWFTNHQLTAMRGASTDRARERLGWKPSVSWRRGLASG